MIMKPESATSELALDAFFEQLRHYLGQNSSSLESRRFEQRIEKEAAEQLLPMGQDGWDFEIVHPVFEDRGTSILIQNAQLDWQSVLTRLCTSCVELPIGAIINFEIYDSIQEGAMVGGSLVQRCVFTSNGAFMHR